ncbi:nicotinate phosphoribosyltransferase [Campylobacter insulaenigrae]|uniref:nicotinate phosphoribosyltransferase n=1 Tax=Campylobacter insulaenigrae TaxID=260714 RepID=UPI00242A7B26|nr:nicotinate phosphoribosyltransferase [Campylobacter insulaenigrae]
MNHTLLCDFYELTMAYAYFKQNKHKQIAYFEVFFRQTPDNANFAIYAGLKQIIDHVQNFFFTQDDIHYLKSVNKFDCEFLDYISTIRFSGDMYSIQEGECIFTNEPLLYIKAPIIEALLLETFILLTLNHQCLIATKASRIYLNAHKKILLEFGSRRAHGESSAINGARAAFIGGFDATANTLAGKIFNIPISGTMSHAWVQMHNNEIEAFEAYCKIYQDNITLLVDTYNCIKGIENAILVFKKFKNKNLKNYAIRIDSGNILKLSKLARKMLDENNLYDCKIFVSNALDEIKISKLLKNKAPIDGFGVGENLITSASSPIFGAVYKLVAIEENNQIIPKIKISEQSSKTTLPSFKKLIRYYKNNKIYFDKLYNHDEKILNYKNLHSKEMLNLIFTDGKLVYESPDLLSIQDFYKENISKLNQKYKKLNNISFYKVKISKRLKNIQQQLI